MILAAATAVTPAWLTVALVGITSLGAAISAVASVLNALVAAERLKALEANQKQHHAEAVAAHAEVMQALQSR